jgi:hypothetical protein
MINTPGFADAFVVLQSPVWAAEIRLAPARTKRTLENP